jgi:hypothetical protein
VFYEHFVTMFTEYADLEVCKGNFYQNYQVLHLYDGRGIEDVLCEGHWGQQRNTDQAAPQERPRISSRAHRR